MSDETIACAVCAHVCPRDAFGTSMWKKKKTKAPTCLECVANPGWHETGAEHPALKAKEEDTAAADEAQEDTKEGLAKLAVEDEESQPVEAAVEKEEPKFVKRILKKGDKDTIPKPKDSVKVNYTGKLEDGTVFDTTWKSHKNMHFSLQFKVGTGRVIKGWDECIMTMGVGEKCEVTIEPAGAYGKKGNPPKIPPNATLIFEIELLACGF